MRAHQHKEHPNIQGLTIIKVPQEGAQVDNATGEIIKQTGSSNQQSGLSRLQTRQGTANQHSGQNLVQDSPEIANEHSELSSEMRQRLKEIQSMKHQMWSKINSVSKKGALPTMVPLPSVGNIGLSPLKFPDSLTVTMSSVFPGQENMENSRAKPQMQAEFPVKSETSGKSQGSPKEEANAQAQSQENTQGQYQSNPKTLGKSHSTQVQHQTRTDSENQAAGTSLNSPRSTGPDLTDDELGVVSSVDIIKHESQTAANISQPAIPTNTALNMLETATPTSTAIKPTSRRKAPPIKRELDCNDLSSSSCETSPEVYPTSKAFPIQSAADPVSSPYFNTATGIGRSNMPMRDTAFPTSTYLATQGPASLAMQHPTSAMTMQQPSQYGHIKQETLNACYPGEHSVQALSHAQPGLPPPVTPSNMWRQDNMFGVTYPQNILNQQGSTMTAQKPSPVALYSNYYQ